jgi:copper(I)-binding protein
MKQADPAAGNLRRLASPRRVPAVIRLIAAAAALLAGGGAVAGCAQQADAAGSIELGTAYVNEPASASGSGDITDAYLVIRNNGPTDRLVSARTSVGGRVTFRAPVGTGSDTMRTVPDISVPADSLMRLSPDADHLLISGAGPMQAGRQITLVLVFAQGGAMTVAAEVTNPATGGSSYFLN